MDKFAGGELMGAFGAPAPLGIGAGDSGRSWRESFSLMLIGRAASSCATSQLNDANVSDTDMPA